MYLRKDDTPYYIGKGKGRRLYSKNHGRVSVPKDKSRIKIFKDNLTEEEAISLEIQLIKEFGRKDTGAGILLNLTDGGEGSSGRVLPESSIKKMRAAATKLNKEKICGFGIGHARAAGLVGGKSTSIRKISSSQSNIEKTREIHKNSIWVYDPINKKRKRIKEEALVSFINQGWIKGFRPVP